MLDPIEPLTPRARRATLAWSLLGLIALWGYLLIFHFHHQTAHGERHLGDFPTFYMAAGNALHHRDIYQAGQINAHGVKEQVYVYPPLIAFLYSPLARLSVLSAARIMLPLTALMLLGSILLCAAATLQRLRVPASPHVICLIALIVSVLAENEIRGELTMLETDALMLLMFALALWWLDRRPVAAGLALALALNVKYLSLVALPYLLLRRRWRAAAAMIGGAIFFALLPALLLGWREDLRCLRVALGGLLPWLGIASHTAAAHVHGAADNLSVSITSALARLARGHGDRLAMELAALVALVTGAVVAVLYRLNRLPLLRWPRASAQRRQPYAALVGFEWAGLVAAALIFSPDTNTRHLVLTIIVYCAAWALIVKPAAAPVRWMAILGALLIPLAYIGLVPRSMIHAYFRWSVATIGLLIGYLLILVAALRHIRADSAEA